MRVISKQIWEKMLMQNCNKSKHRLRQNKYGITYCVICGLLSNTNNAIELQEEDRLNIELA